MGLGNTWQRYLAWRRAKIAQYSAPDWRVDRKPLVGLHEGLTPELQRGEQRVFASLSSVTRGWLDFRAANGSLWLTDRRLIFVAPGWAAFPFGFRYLELPRRTITSARLCSIWRSFACPSGPVRRAFEVRTEDGERYIFQAFSAQRWVEELDPGAGSDGLHRSA